LGNINIDCFGTNKEVGTLKKRNEELKEVVISLETDNNNLENQVKQLK